MQPRVLIVDDEDMIRTTLKAYLEDEDIPALSVASAEEAIQQVKNSSRFTVCIMDMRLPGMDGNAGIRILHALCPDMAFIIHTGSAEYTLPNDLRAMGLNETRIYIKPLGDIAPLARAVRALSEQKDAE